jgi:hypothetical protein
MVLRSSWADPSGNARKARNLEQVGVVGDVGIEGLAENTLKARLRVQRRCPGSEEERGDKRHERMARGTGLTVGANACRRSKAEEGSDPREG